MTERNRSYDERIRQANARLAEAGANITNPRYRLHYHLMPPSGWMNDPNGLIQYKGEYHAFYQHDPYQAKQGPMHWGHAKSKDLVVWEHLPVALAPSEPYDLDESGSAGGCWSGSAVVDDGKLMLLYTGHVDGRTPEEAQCLAVSDDGILFDKAAANPVIPGPPEEGCFGFRDPKVWKRGGRWYMVVGSGKNGKGRALLYRSEDLRNWRYAGVAAESDGTRGNMWECPDLFPLGEGDEHVLIVSPMDMGATKTYYMSGTFDYESGAFREVYAERLDYGFDFYAPQTLLDDRGRRILLGWMNIWGAAMPEQEDGWMGAMTLPRELKRSADGTVRMLPVEELKTLRKERRVIEPRKLLSDAVVPLSEIRGDALEIIAEFDLRETDAEVFGFRLRCSADGGEYTEIRYRLPERTLEVDRNRAGRGDGGVSGAIVAPMADGTLKLHMYLDRSSIELFANDGEKTLTNRIYPDPDSTGVQLFSLGGEASLRSFEVWTLRSIW